MSCELHFESFLLSLGQQLTYFRHHQAFSLILESSESSSYVGAFSNDVESFSRVENWKCAGKVSVLRMKFLYVLLNRLVEFHCLPDSHLKTLRSTSMASVSHNSQLNFCELAHHCPFFAPNISKGSNWPVMKAIYLVNSFKTAMFYHEFCSWFRPFFGWLEQKSYFFVVGNVVKLS